MEKLAPIKVHFPGYPFGGFGGSPLQQESDDVQPGSRIHLVFTASCEQAPEETGNAEDQNHFRIPDSHKHSSNGLLQTDINCKRDPAIFLGQGRIAAPLARSSRPRTTVSIPAVKAQGNGADPGGFVGHSYDSARKNCEFAEEKSGAGEGDRASETDPGDVRVLGVG